MTTTTLRDGTQAADPRLDRLVRFDERSRGFGIRPMIPVTRRVRSRQWECDVWLDQGREGACVGFGLAHELAAKPSPVRPMTAAYARESIYWAAQRDDEWPGGSYPGAEPVYEGTSVLAGLRTVRRLGWCEGYRWAFGLLDLLIGLAWSGPAVLGVAWYEGMLQPDGAGQIRPTGRIAGGHCILATGVDAASKRVWLHNSWGRGWGLDGDCWLTWDDADVLLKQQGEAAFLIGRHKYARPRVAAETAATP